MMNSGRPLGDLKQSEFQMLLSRTLSEELDETRKNVAEIKTGVSRQRFSNTMFALAGIAATILVAMQFHEVRQQNAELQEQIQQLQQQLEKQ